MPDVDDLQRRRAVQDRIAASCGIRRRAEWRAREPMHPLQPDWNYDSIVMHYTGHGNYPNVRSIQDFDIDHQNWDDIAYHYAVTKEGQVFEGREIIYKGSHVKLQNTGKIGIVCVGDFDANWRNLFQGHSPSGDQVEQPMLAAVRRLCRTLISCFPIRVFGGHKEYGDVETCPGSNLMPVVATLRQEFRLSAPVFRRF
ncbi:MAG: N-acetylmuramoyl-L-alanine amidase [Gluconacetobacter diazotrophicus]|nr:N-acetylmuramoyl-L-alanine amidase [Gluconacetobacter diazotrophicus]